ncbi:putative alx-like TerC family integral membrane protein [Candidatus Fokinia solitaria]|uniref:Putative alx-like TerC family integral membrane protein n=1 Tax=Candidatus Fokinia solitaria TaxID=1802984 RepID=A0A2U8BR71_9RICK|nr:TerC family protein [Candidatus Fokinia solitaria]AWD32829.1 putative alx-like TerC family integral membrane protein [Candidatus Fokinia solitaria]
MFEFVLHNKHSKQAQKSENISTVLYVLTASIVCFMTYFYFYTRDISFVEQFITGYLIELSLSIDNVFVFIMLFDAFKISKKQQYKILMLGIIGAIMMRMTIILLGIPIIAKFNWIIAIFGAILLVGGIKVVNKFFKKNHSKSNIVAAKHEEKEAGIFIRWLTKFSPIILRKLRITFDKDYIGDKFFVIRDGTLVITRLFGILLLVEKADLLFALDSIPAIASVTDSSFIIFSSNAFAVLGLRTIYHFLSGIIHTALFLELSLGFTLIFVGSKMLLKIAHYEINNTFSILIILSIFVIPEIVRYFTRKQER